MYNTHVLAPFLLWAVSGLALTPIEREIIPVVDLFYDLEFEKASAEADALAARHPGHPAGPFYRSIVFYQKFLAEEPKSPATLAAFERECAAAIQAAEAMKASAPAEGFYYAGVARGFHARVLAAQKRYLRALPEGLRSVRALQAALERDPGLEDAYLGLGMYHYFAARIPAGAKPFAYLVGAGWGDKDKGISYLQRAAEKGGPAKMEARSMLSSVYALEGRWAESDALLQELMRRYPRNPLYRMRRVYVNERAGRMAEALASADPSGAWLEKLPPFIKKSARPAALYRAAEIELALGRPEASAALLDALDKTAGVPEALRDFGWIRRGNILDAAGRRAEAVAFYRKPSHPAAVKLARQYLEKPYPAGDQYVMPWLGLETPR